MRILSPKESIGNMVQALLISGKEVASNAWQAQTVGSFKMIEVCDLFVRMHMVENRSQLAEDILADLPWAEDHFMERISGVASNPGKEYRNWPYWKVDNRFMEGQVFSHTYQERFWPPSKIGIRYKAGNYTDIALRLAKDTTTRQAFLTIWHPEDQSDNGVRVPCSIGYWFNIREEKLNVTYLIRSCDARRHLRNDVYMCQRLAMHTLEHVNLIRKDNPIGLGIMSMWVGSLHCFTSDINYLKKK